MLRFLQRALSFLLARVAVPEILDWASRDTVPYRPRPKPTAETVLSYMDIVVERADRHQVSGWFVMDVGPRIREVVFTYRAADDSLAVEQTEYDLEPFYETFMLDARDAYAARIDMSAIMN